MRPRDLERGKWNYIIFPIYSSMLFIEEFDFVIKWDSAAAEKGGLMFGFWLNSSLFPSTRPSSEENGEKKKKRKQNFKKKERKKINSLLHTATLSCAKKVSGKTLENHRLNFFYFQWEPAEPCFPWKKWLHSGTHLYFHQSRAKSHYLPQYYWSHRLISVGMQGYWFQYWLSKLDFSDQFKKSSSYLQEVRIFLCRYRTCHRYWDILVVL